jgi:predicted metalloprotease
MKWEPGHTSADVEDRRGSSGRRGMMIGGGSIGMAIVLWLISQALGIDVSGGGGGTSGQPSGQYQGSAEEQKEYDFLSFVLDDVQGVFEKLFAKEGKRYRHAKLDFFTEEIDTGCGRSSAAVGPFYCPPDEKAYIDLSFFQVLRDRLGAGGDFAQAYVLAHEIGHHVQKLRGLPARSDSVRTELQADCYAGVWAHYTEQEGLVQDGDIDEAVNAAAQIGDDRLSEMAGETPNPETFTHGTSEQRSRWFTTGYRSGQFDACDTFSSSI